MPQSDPFTTRESMERLRFLSLDATIRHLRQSGLKPIRRGSRLLWNRDEVLALLQRADAGKEGQP